MIRPGDQPQDTENEQWPVTLSGRLIAESGHEHGDAVDEYVDADEYHPGHWADEGEQPDDDEEDASEQEHPPLLGKLKSQSACDERSFAERGPSGPYRASLTHTDPPLHGPAPQFAGLSVQFPAHAVAAPVATATCPQSITQVLRTIESFALQARIVLR